MSVQRDLARLGVDHPAITLAQSPASAAHQISYQFAAPRASHWSRKVPTRARARRERAPSEQLLR